MTPSLSFFLMYLKIFIFILYTEVLTTQCFFSLSFIIYFWLCRVVIAAHRVFLVGVSLGLLSSCGVQASPYAGSSACGARARGREGFRSCGLGTPDQRLSSCGTLAQLPHSIRDLPSPRIEPMSLALQGRFLTTGPPGKPRLHRL